MISRGIFIGKIIDDLALLKFRIETRNKLGYFDLTKICEDFFKEVLNYTYNYSLINLNSARLNNPGIDLGDETNGIAYQITSQKTTAKINQTLNAIVPRQKKLFNKIRIFVIGEKQGSYTVLDKNLCKEYDFGVENIHDINTLLRDIVLLDIDQLEPLYKLFQRDFRHIIIELEPLDSEGNYDSSYYNILEKKPSSPPKNGKKFIEDIDKEEKKDLLKLYEKLSCVPRVTRELLSIIAERGKFNDLPNFYDRYHINYESLKRIMRFNDAELMSEINILEEVDLVSLDSVYVGEGDRDVYHVIIYGEMLNQLISWLIFEKLPLRTFLNIMDFTILDEK
ncbi:MAG TPA: SMEK domain-containing protein [Ignavibacteria bacterium]